MTVIQHHHIALTCTANGGRIDRKMSTFIFEDYFQEIHGLQYHGKKMVYPSTELVHDTGKSWRAEKDDYGLVNVCLRIGPDGSQLLIIQADPTQAGIYTCLAYSKAGEAKQHFRLTVLGLNRKISYSQVLICFFFIVPPRIQRENTSYLVTSPKPIELPCRVIQGHPIPIVK